MQIPRRMVAGLGIVAVLVAVAAVPALAAKPENAHPETSAITITGTVLVAAGPEGRDAYTLKDGGTTYQLEAGPAWFFGEHYPLKPYVGKNVTIVGEIAKGSTQVEVVSVDGIALRAPGKPPWAGGWRVVGSIHPGWSQDKADRFKAKFGDCFPPGQCKDKPAHPGNGRGSGGPDASEAPEGSETPD
jgi:hypothetical protein